MHIRSLACLALLITALPASAQITVDGSRVGDAYGSARAVQTVNTSWGDNTNELNAAYAVVENGRLYLMVTGNVADIFNKLEVFIDSVPGGENVLSGVPGNDGSTAMTGFEFDAGFTADHHVIARRGVSGTPQFHLDVSRLGTASFSQHLDVFGGANVGSGTTGLGPANASTIQVAYSNANVGGVVAGTGAANAAAAQAATAGFEMSIALTDLSSPAGDLRVLVFVNSVGHNFASNQFLPGLPAPQDTLGGDGAGGFTGQLQLDMADYGGNQFFVVPYTPPALGTNYCTSDLNSTGTAAVMSAVGSASLAANDLTLMAGTVPDSLGVFFYGTSTTNLPFGNGTRCIAGALRLYPAAVSVGGTATRAVDLLAKGILPGTVHFQYGFRDSAAGGAEFDLSDGYSIVFIP